MIVHSEHTDLPTPTGPMRTFVYRPVPHGPAGPRFPGLICYSEIFQQTEPIRRLAVQLAGHGYVVMVPEIYHAHEPAGTVLGYDDPGKDRGNARKAGMKLADFDADVRVLLTALTGHASCNGRLGTFGVCLGGHLAFRAALQPEVRAAACFYATDLQGSSAGELGNGDTLRRAGEIKGELLHVWGRQDPHVPVEGRLAIYRKLHESGVVFTWHEFNAEHAFLRDEGSRHDPAAARLGMGLVLDLFTRVL